MKDRKQENEIRLLMQNKQTTHMLSVTDKIIGDKMNASYRQDIINATRIKK